MDIKKYKSHARLLIAVDCIIFGFDGKELKALLIKCDFEPQKGKWSLMGGFVFKDENVDQAAARILKQLTGLTDIYMEQLHCFGDVDRDSAGRVISVAYSALINIVEYNEQLSDQHKAHWFPMTKLPKLIFDHGQMVQKAKEHVQQKAATYSIDFELLPTKFTLPRLQNLYESIYEKPLCRRNFIKKIFALNMLKKLNEKEKQSSRKGAFYFTLDQKYETNSGVKARSVGYPETAMYKRQSLR